jgi:hypothetical protein
MNLAPFLKGIHPARRAPAGQRGVAGAPHWTIEGVRNYSEHFPNGCAILKLWGGRMVSAMEQSLIGLYTPAEAERLIAVSAGKLVRLNGSRRLEKTLKRGL